MNGFGAGREGGSWATRQRPFPPARYAQ